LPETNTNLTIYTLGASRKKGFYKLVEHPLLDTSGPDLNVGARIAIEVAGQFFPGRVMTDAMMYASDLWVEQRLLRGHFFMADQRNADGSVCFCGLCLGMRVRLLE
jgi:hypothetical protein